MKKILTVLGLVSVVTLTGCQRDAQVASQNLSKAADMFEIDRRIVFYNGITGEYMLTVEGKCSIKDANRQLEVTCKTGSSAFKKHFLGLSDNVTYFAEQVEGVGVSTYHNRIIFKPQSIIPNIDINGSTEDFVDNVVSK
ncbi:hypothetical protein KUA24_119 [Vibrio phage HNL01]|nr:hypothetical protein KUA24_119 [Vibrio phage HNL01]